MVWHVTLYNVLTTVNNVLLVLIGIPFILQLVYMFLFWLPKKRFPKSKKKKKICILIPAHNEEDVIGGTVRELFECQKYPRKLFDVYVVAHNCSDRTAELDLLLRRLQAGDIVSVIYFTGQDYERLTGCVSRVSAADAALTVVNRVIPFSDIYELRLEGE